jgi:thiamine-phosphate pyrophosphorylase
VNPEDRRDALERARLYLVCDGGLSPGVLRGVIEAGTGLVQLRMKEAEASAIVEKGREYLGVCEAAGVPFLVNDRPDVALALGADGVHLGQEDLPPSVARQILGPQALIGRSTHSPKDIQTALAEHEEGLADYIAVGPVHETPTKPGRPSVGLELIEHAAEHVRLPWFAIGGIDSTNIGEVVGKGAQRAVVVRAITQALDPVAATNSLMRQLGNSA